MTKPENLSDVKSVEDLAQFVGLKPGEGNAILKEVRENHSKLATCTRHQFRRPQISASLFAQGFFCLNCGGRMTGEKITYYAEGVGHAGKPFDVWVE